MPTYTYKCKDCEKVMDAFRSIEERNDCPVCGCGGKTEKCIVPTQVQPQMPGYECPVTGEYVTSRRRRVEIMKENNLVEAG